MQTNKPFIDDMTRAAGGALGLAGSVRREIEGMIRARVEKIASDLDLVSRDELDAAMELARRAQEGNRALEKRIRALESALEKKPSKPKRKTDKKTASGTARGKAETAKSSHPAGRKAKKK